MPHCKPLPPNTTGRRRFIKVCAAQSLALLAPSAWSRLAKRSEPARWNGIVLGAEASIEIHHENRPFAKGLVEESLAEILRLERLFTLYDETSALRRLNLEGRLMSPDPAFLDLLNRAVVLSERTSGLFDVSVHPAVENLRLARPENAPFLNMGYDKIRILSDSVRLEPGMALTFNGIAQGYITDCIADLLATRGIEKSLIDIGEKRALGSHPTGRPWQIGIVDPESPNRMANVLPLIDGALATSGFYGTLFSASPLRHHLVDPRTGQNISHFASVTVRAPRATVADALSTALAVAAPQEISEIVKRFPEARVTFGKAAPSVARFPAKKL